MFKHTLTYEDYDGNKRTEDFYFNLRKDELNDLQFQLGGSTGNFEQAIIKIISEQDMQKLMEIFKSILDNSYGEKSDDGKYFFKSPEILAKFKATPAYEAMYMRMATDSKFSSDFINKVFPKDLQGAAEEARADVEKKIAAYLPTDDKPTGTLQIVE